jgi:hypothetical protein
MIIKLIFNNFIVTINGQKAITLSVFAYTANKLPVFRSILQKTLMQQWWVNLFALDDF